MIKYRSSASSDFDLKLGVVNPDFFRDNEFVKGALFVFIEGFLVVPVMCRSWLLLHFAGFWKNDHSLAGRRVNHGLELDLEGVVGGGFEVEVEQNFWTFGSHPVNFLISKLV